MTFAEIHQYVRNYLPLEDDEVIVEESPRAIVVKVPVWISRQEVKGLTRCLSQEFQKTFWVRRSLA